MPTLTRWFVKASLLFLIAALLLAFAMAARQVLSLPAVVSALVPVYFHLFLVGWITQLIFGVVFWMFPKFSMEKPRGSETLGWLTFILINAGLVLRMFAEPLQSLQPSLLSGWALVGSAALQWTAGLLFVINTWPRVKEK